MRLIGPNMQLNHSAKRPFAAFRHGFGLIRFTIAAAKLWLGRSGRFPAAPNPKSKHIKMPAELTWDSPAFFMTALPPGMVSQAQQKPP